MPHKIITEKIPGKMLAQFFANFTEISIEIYEKFLLKKCDI